jgi:hypothetical protein
MYLKIFKDVRSIDIDMMIPGSAMEFSASLRFASTSLCIFVTFFEGGGECQLQPLFVDETDVLPLCLCRLMSAAAWLDVAFIWIPTFVGLYSAINAVVDIWGTQKGLLDYATLIVLMLMPLSW